MKKILSIIICLMMCLSMQAQGIYSKATKYDKFDDVVWTKRVKTLITLTGNVLTLETKGQAPITYMCSEYKKTGSKDKIVNLIQNVHGYQIDYLCYTEKEGMTMFDKLNKAGVFDINDPSDDFANSITKYAEKHPVEAIGFVQDILKIAKKFTIRYISRYEFTYEYLTDLAWIEYPDGSRIIYER